MPRGGMPVKRLGGRHRWRPKCCLLSGERLHAHPPCRPDAACRSNPGEGDRPGAHGAADLRRPPAALQPRLPGRREHPGLARPGAGGPLPRGLASAGARQSAARHARPRLLSPVRETLQPQANSTARSASTRSSGSSATWPTRKAGRSPIDAPPSGKRVLVVGAGPSGLSAAYHLRASATRSRSARPARCPAA